MFDLDQLDERPVYRHIKIVTSTSQTGVNTYYGLQACARTRSDAELALVAGGWLTEGFILEIGEDESVDEVYDDALYFRPPRHLLTRPGHTHTYVLGGRLQLN